MCQKPFSPLKVDQVSAVITMGVKGLSPSVAGKLPHGGTMLIFDPGPCKAPSVCHSEMCVE